MLLEFILIVRCHSIWSIVAFKVLLVAGSTSALGLIIWKSQET